MGEKEKPQSWWKTIPGILTAVAGLITAVSGLILALHQTGIFKAKSPLPSESLPIITVPIPSEDLSRALEDSKAVQTLYGQSKPLRFNCVELRRIVEQIRLYEDNNRLVPESLRHTVIYPYKKPMPTISDLAIDRITRIKNVSPQCF